MKSTDQISAVILAKNEASSIVACISCLRWCDEVIVLDTGSTDETLELAEAHGARVISFQHRSFARVRDEALKHVNSEWIFYVDADERVSPTLAQEITTHLIDSNISVLELNRENYFYGRKMSHGGWASDRVTRIFRCAALKGWQGEIHESPEFTGNQILLKNNLIHLSHRTTAAGLIKSAEWTLIEAKLLQKNQAQPVKFVTILRKSIGEFWRRAIKKRGFRDGTTGLVESLIQAINRMLVYIQVWELQQKPSIPDLYSVKERQIELDWERTKKSPSIKS